MLKWECLINTNKCGVSGWLILQFAMQQKNYENYSISLELLSLFILSFFFPNLLRGKNEKKIAIILKKRIKFLDYIVLAI